MHSLEEFAICNGCYHRSQCSYVRKVCPIDISLYGSVGGYYDYDSIEEFNRKAKTIPYNCPAGFKTLSKIEKIPKSEN